MTQSFDEWFEKHGELYREPTSDERYSFEAGAQSRQAEIDELRKRIDEALLYAVSKYDDDGWLDGIELNRLIKTLK